MPCVFIFSLKMMKIVEALENKGFRVPLTNEEVQLRDKLLTMAKRVFPFSFHFSLLFLLLALGNCYKL